jgi:hypothetical protein
VIAGISFKGWLIPINVPVPTIVGLSTSLCAMLVKLNRLKKKIVMKKCFICIVVFLRSEIVTD